MWDVAYGGWRRLDVQTIDEVSEGTSYKKMPADWRDDPTMTFNGGKIKNLSVLVSALDQAIGTDSSGAKALDAEESFKGRTAVGCDTFGGMSYKTFDAVPDVKHRVLKVAYDAYVTDPSKGYGYTRIKITHGSTTYIPDANGWAHSNNSYNHYERTFTAEDSDFNEAMTIKLETKICSDGTGTNKIYVKNFEILEIRHVSRRIDTS